MDAYRGIWDSIKIMGGGLSAKRPKMTSPTDSDDTERIYELPKA